MVADDLKISEVAVLVALMVEAGEVLNSDLKERYGVSLVGESKQRLNDRKFVTSRKVGRGVAHELTDEGWARVRDELSAPCPPKAGVPGGGLYALLNGLGRHLDRTGISLAEIFSPGPGAAGDDVEEAIRAAYRKAPRLAGGGVTLTALRPLLGQVPRQAVDEALVRMGRQPRISLLPNENQGGLTDADRAAAVRIGPVSYHYLRIEDV